MKISYESLNQLPKPLLELLSFVLFVLSGSLFKMRRQHEKGVKITFMRFIAEAFTSFFIAAIAYASIDQFFHFNKLFIYALCGLAGSMSEPISLKLEELLNNLFEAIKKTILR